MDDDIETLTGRPLDAALERRLFGYDVEERVSSRTHKPELLRRLDNDVWVVIPYYSTRMSAGLNVGDQLRRLGWTVDEASSNRRPDVGGRYFVTLNGHEGERVTASGESWELALARTALKTVPI